MSSQVPIVFIMLALGLGCGKKEVEPAEISATPPAVQPLIESTPPIVQKELFFDQDNLDHRKIETAINVTLRQKKQQGQATLTGMRIIPRRAWPKLKSGDVLQLTELDVGGKDISDISPLSGVRQLKSLFLTENQITDLSPLAGHTQLLSLTLDGNGQLQDLSPLVNLKGLRLLYLDRNHVADLSPLAGLTELKYLYLRDNQVDNLEPLGNLKHLVVLDLGGNKFTDLIPLMNLSELKHLSVDDSPYLPQDEIEKLQSALPHCKISHDASE